MKHSRQANRLKDRTGVGLLLMISIFSQNLGLCRCLNEEGLALLRVKDKVVSDPFGALRNWNENDGEIDPCSWFGVECSDGRVVVLNLRDLCLRGTLAPEIGNLVHIRAIILRDNTFSGVIPEEIGVLKELEVLDLGCNNFSGTLPYKLGNNFLLEILLVDNNELLTASSAEIRELTLASESRVDENHLSIAANKLACKVRQNAWKVEQTSNVIHRRVLAAVSVNMTVRQTGVRVPTPPPMPPSPSPAPSVRTITKSSSATITVPSTGVRVPTPTPMPPSLSQAPTLAPAPSTPSTPTPVPPSSASPAPAPTPAHAKSSHQAFIGGAVGGSVFILITILGAYLYRSNKVATVKPWDTGLSGQLKKAFVTGCALGSSSLVLVMTLLYIFKRRILSVGETSCFGKDETAEERANAVQFIRNCRSTLLTKYSYRDIRKMTNALKERLGEGGYGTVYKGRLPDGRPIAVKMLDKSSNNSQDFINEVATIGTIHHVSIIRLLGFCLEGSKRALIYEYMPNGSLGDLLHKEGPNHYLATERLLEIAIGIALGIEYLHKGCNSRILHLDIKPHNILLDQNFNPKISDFGLAKMYSRDRNSIAMTGARGTIGFIAPEIFMRNLGNPSHKSDVYSFGMLLLEMVGVRKHEEAKGNASSESYFPSRIYNEINKDRPLEFGDLVEEEVAVSRKMVMVGLWCIQINPKDRPSMTQVLEMLMGSSESIPMPPKPQFFSPPRAQVVPGSSSTDVDASGVTLTLDSQEM